MSRIPDGVRVQSTPEWAVRTEVDRMEVDHTSPRLVTRARAALDEALVSCWTHRNDNDRDGCRYSFADTDVVLQIDDPLFLERPAYLHLTTTQATEVAAHLILCARVAERDIAAQLAGGDR